MAITDLQCFGASVSFGSYTVKKNSAATGAMRGNWQAEPSKAVRQGGQDAHPADTGSVPRFINQFAFENPWHHVAQLFADQFDLVLIVGPASCLNCGLANGVFQHEITHEFALGTIDLWTKLTKQKSS